MSTQQELIELKATYQSLKNAEKHLVKVETELKSARQTLAALSKILDKELKDVERLEGLSIKGLFHKVLGDQESQLEQERQEYLQAVLKYNEQEKAVELLEFELEVLVKKLQDGGGLEAKIDQLTKRRIKELENQYTPIALKVKNIEQQIENAYLSKRTFHEAMQIGTQAAELLALMNKQLTQARDWGMWDIAGKDRRAAYMKRTHIDKAKEIAYQTQRHLSHFKEVLDDIYQESFHFPIRIDQFGHFTDIFFDNLISDWIIQQKIQNALSSVTSTKDKVNRILASLKQQFQQMDTTINTLEQQKKKIVLDSIG